MKTALWKAAKLGAILAIPIFSILVISIWFVLSRNTLQADYEKIQVGMTLGEVYTILPDENYVSSVPGGHHKLWLRFDPPESTLIPCGTIWVVVDDETELVTHKTIEFREKNEFWKHWKRKLRL
jgi:hypothetical protein